MLNKISGDVTNTNILLEIGQRIKRARLRCVLSQDDMATKTGLSLKTIQNMEKGGGTLGSLISILRALDELDSLDKTFLVPAISPLELLKQSSKQTQNTQKRVRRTRVRNHE